MNKSSKIYITGHTGMVGSAIRKVLEENGYNNIAFKSSSELDLREKKEVSKYIADNRPDVVIHTAAKVGGIQANINEPVSFLSDNIEINFNVLNACLSNEVRQVVFLGSSCMYPKDYKNPLKEEYILNAPLEPTNEGYALSKICGAKFCEYVNREKDWNYKTLIPCNLFGENDHFRTEKSHLIAAIIRKIYEAVKKEKETVTIWGDGTARREFLYVDDLANFVVNNLNKLSELPDMLNVGYGEDFSVNEYYKMVADILDFEGSFEHDLSKPTGMKFKLIDSTRAFNLGWEPQHDIKEGLKKTCEYYKSIVN